MEKSPRVGAPTGPNGFQETLVKGGMLGWGVEGTIRRNVMSSTVDKGKNPRSRTVGIKDAGISVSAGIPDANI